MGELSEGQRGRVPFISYFTFCVLPVHIQKVTLNMTQKTALITGTSRGLGLALTHALADRNWSLIMDARGADALKEAERALAAKTDIIAIAGDVRSPEHRQALVDAVEKSGGLDVLVNNASLLGPSPQPNLLDYPLDVLNDVYQVNVLAPLALLQAVKDHAKDDFRVLNVTSDAGVEAYAGWGGYGSSKAALEQWTAILAQEQPGWKVYQVDPGDMRTRMHQEAFPGEDISDRPFPDVSVPGFLQLIEGDLPSGRYQAQTMTGSENHQTIHELRLILTARQFDAALRFYQEGLGLELLEDWSEGNQRGMLFKAGYATLELNNETQAAYLDEVEVGERVAGDVRLAFKVDDTEQFSHQVIASGAKALSGVVDTPWQDRHQRLQAHDDIQVTLFQEIR